MIRDKFEEELFKCEQAQYLYRDKFLTWEKQIDLIQRPLLF